ncbi:MAG: TrmH family RNA methyltransferase [Bacteroidetes bacterium]|nr:TrmH family RNA methyltransferase [Bacteroidota bacterium]
MRKLRHEEIHRPSPDELSGMGRHPVVLILDNIRSAHNVGSIVRTADALRLHEVVCCGFTPAADHRSVFKTSLGAEATVPWRHANRAVDVVKDLKASGYHVAALELTDAPRTADDVSLAAFPLALIAGNEVDGVSDALMGMCDSSMEIPQYGAKQSLNVAVAVGIAAHDLVRRYRILTHQPLFSAGDPRFRLASSSQT